MTSSNTRQPPGTPGREPSPSTGAAVKRWRSSRQPGPPPPRWAKPTASAPPACRSARREALWQRALWQRALRAPATSSRAIASREACSSTLASSSASSSIRLRSRSASAREAASRRLSSSISEPIHGLLPPAHDGRRPSRRSAGHPAKPLARSPFRRVHPMVILEADGPPRTSNGDSAGFALSRKAGT